MTISDIASSAGRSRHPSSRSGICPTGDISECDVIHPRADIPMISVVSPPTPIIQRSSRGMRRVGRSTPPEPHSRPSGSNLSAPPWWHEQLSSGRFVVTRSRSKNRRGSLRIVQIPLVPVGSGCRPRPNLSPRTASASCVPSTCRPDWRLYRQHSSRPTAAPLRHRRGCCHGGSRSFGLSQRHLLRCGRAGVDG